MHNHRLSFISLALLAASCTPPHVSRSGDGSIDNPEVSGSGGGGGAGGAGGAAGSGGGAGGSCGSPTIEGAGCSTPAYFHFDSKVGQDSGLQGWTGEGTGFTSVKNLRTWCSHTWCGNGAMTFDCNLDTSAGNPGLNACAVQVTGLPSTSGLTATSTISFGLKAFNLTTDDWLRVFVTVLTPGGYSAPLFAGNARTNSWFRYDAGGASQLFSVDLTKLTPVPQQIDGIQIYLDVNSNDVTWTGTVWIDEIGWR